MGHHHRGYGLSVEFFSSYTGKYNFNFILSGATNVCTGKEVSSGRRITTWLDFFSERSFQ